MRAVILDSARYLTLWLGNALVLAAGILAQESPSSEATVAEYFEGIASKPSPPPLSGILPTWMDACGRLSSTSGLDHIRAILNGLEAIDGRWDAIESNDFPVDDGELRRFVEVAFRSKQPSTESMPTADLVVLERGFAKCTMARHLVWSNAIVPCVRLFMHHAGGAQYASADRVARAEAELRRFVPLCYAHYEKVAQELYNRARDPGMKARVLARFALLMEDYELIRSATAFMDKSLGYVMSTTSLVGMARLLAKRGAVEKARECANLALRTATERKEDQNAGAVREYHAKLTAHLQLAGKTQEIGRPKNDVERLTLAQLYLDLDCGGVAVAMPLGSPSPCGGPLPRRSE